MLHACLAEGRGAAAGRRRHRGESLNCWVLAGGVPAWPGRCSSPAWDAGAWPPCRCSEARDRDIPGRRRTRKPRHWQHGHRGGGRKTVQGGRRRRKTVWGYASAAPWGAGLNPEGVRDRHGVMGRRQLAARGRKQRRRSGPAPGCRARGARSGAGAGMLRREVA